MEACKDASTFLQSGFWGSFKACFGWNVRAFKAYWDSGYGTEQVLPLMVIRRRLAPGCSFAYVPWGPEVPEDFSVEDKAQALAELAPALRPFLPGDTVFVRFDPPWAVEEMPDEGEECSLARPLTFGAPFVRASANVQPPDTVLIDLTPATMDKVVESFKSKTRYNARLALRKGVTVINTGLGGLDDFYFLLKETARRDGIAIHSIDYYRTLFEHAAPYEMVDIRLYLARLDRELLAGIVTLFRQDEAVYLYGASSSLHRNLMAPYALQVQAMTDAKDMGCTYYDLFGIPPSADLNHPMHGLYQFKTGFGGTIIHRPGSWDFPYNKAIYRLFRFAEKARKDWRDRKKK
jgi:lipid II:glycine glycyltransferase (peptidoglycan interpeptide bridge formation enzyme)